jgi:hypothetical protein
MNIPAVEGFETGKSHVFLPAIRKMDLLSQPGASDLIGVIRRCA